MISSNMNNGNNISNALPPVIPFYDSSPVPYTSLKGPTKLVPHISNIQPCFDEASNGHESTTLTMNLVFKNRWCFDFK